MMGFHAMVEVLIIHRDLKLQNIMVHFPDNEDQLLSMNQEERLQFFQDIDLLQTRFIVKIADFGYSKKLKKLS